LPVLNALLHNITAPSLLFSSREDHLVASTDGDVLASAVGGPLRRIWLENSYHVATLDNDAELIENETVAFLVKEMVP
jgi:carboxylesterase